MDNDDDDDGIPDDEDVDDDNDGIPDALDLDDDNDGIPDEIDWSKIEIDTSSVNQGDFDDDGILDHLVDAENGNYKKGCGYYYQFWFNYSKECL